MGGNTRSLGCAAKELGVGLQFGPEKSEHPRLPALRSHQVREVVLGSRDETTGTCRAATNNVDGVRQNVHMSWRAFGRKEEEVPTLVEGIPAWLYQAIWRWIAEHLVSHNFVTGGSERNVDLMMVFDVMTRRETPVSAIFKMEGFDGLSKALGQDGTLQLLDFLVHENTSTGEAAGHMRNLRLENILEAGGSAYRVGMRDGEVGLEHRVAEGVQDAAGAAMATPRHAGKLLSQAWHAAFGRNPDPEKAYAQSIKAVEAAAVPVVQPKNSSATFGTVLSQMRTDGDWMFPTDRQHSLLPASQVLLDMMQALWSGQNDRHAGQSDYIPTTQPAGETAVLLAVPLVQWFQSGAVARR